MDCRYRHAWRLDLGGYFRIRPRDGTRDGHDLPTARHGLLRRLHRHRLCPPSPLLPTEARIYLYLPRAALRSAQLPHGSALLLSIKALRRCGEALPHYADPTATGLRTTRRPLPSDCHLSGSDHLAIYPTWGNGYHHLDGRPPDSVPCPCPYPDHLCGIYGARLRRTGYRTSRTPRST